MKRVVLLVLALLMLSSAAMAFSPDSSYVALYMDTLRTGWRVDKGSGITPFEMWIWWLPGASGIQAAEFRIVYPSSIIQTTLIANDSLSISSGTPATAVMCAWIWCQHDWTWSHYQTLYLKDANPAQIQLAPSTVSGQLQIGGCGGIPLEPVRRWNNMCLNYDCGTAVHEKTWGAIKDLYR